MNSTIYYGEIAAIISGKFHNNPDHLLRIGHALGKENKKIRSGHFVQMRRMYLIR